jgi:hypothetical protein
MTQQALQTTSISQKMIKKNGQTPPKASTQTP